PTDPVSVQLSAQTPSVKVFSNSISAPVAVALSFDRASTNFSASFTLPQGLVVAPGLLAFGPSTSISLTHTSFFTLGASGQVLALKKPNANDWAFKQNLNLAFTDGPFTISNDLRTFSMPLK